MEKTKKGVKKVRVGISHGDFNGIGYEVILKTFQDNRMFDFCTPIVYGSSKLASFYKKTIPDMNYNFNTVRSAGQAIDNRLNIINIYHDEAKVDIGESTKLAGELSFESLEAVTQDLGHGIDVMVTAPINKDNIQCEDFQFPGHTEYLASKFGKDKELMVLASQSMRVAVATGHIPLKDVPSTITKELLLNKLETFEQSLKIDFGVRKARIAVLGLNAHAGDNGLLGKEEQDIIIPAIEEAKEKGILAFGPFPADGFFGSNDFTKFDGILAMYHDQGLIPFKALSFEDGVNFTSGLSIIRTSPDHGTGYTIAGKNQADPSSFRASILLAVDIFNKRNEWEGISKNPLKFSINNSGKDASMEDIKPDQEYKAETT
ncbi:MAG: 4-hydroxythreonine-4-phosphate dehydrogenase PdxA [Bacteroidetes bacterium]|nr:MAG: 4-hydroxythreonine-4-phosphate dehydrogenase PdxA [Bacteroidota bacterium]